MPVDAPVMTTVPELGMAANPSRRSPRAWPRQSFIHASSENSSGRSIAAATLISIPVAKKPCSSSGSAPLSSRTSS